jgi:hypothetical protein
LKGGRYTAYYNNWFGIIGIVGLVAQTGQMTSCSGEKWTARTPPKRQAEGSNPSEPVTILVLLCGFHYKKGETRKNGEARNNNVAWSGSVDIIYLCHEGTNDKSLSDKGCKVL